MQSETYPGETKRAVVNKKKTNVGLHLRKYMFCFCRDSNGFLYKELVPQNQTLNSQTEREKIIPVKSIRKVTVFHPVNTGSHVSFQTRQMISNAKLVCRTTQDVFIWSCKFGLPLISLPSKFSYWKSVQFSGSLLSPIKS